MTTKIKIQNLTRTGFDVLLNDLKTGKYKTRFLTARGHLIVGEEEITRHIQVLVEKKMVKLTTVKEVD